MFFDSLKARPCGRAFFLLTLLFFGYNGQTTHPERRPVLRENCMKTAIRLSDRFTCKKLLRFVLPSIVMMVFTSIYGVADGLFVSSFAEKIPFAAINLVMPFIMVLGGLGFMICTAISAPQGGAVRHGCVCRLSAACPVMAFALCVSVAVRGPLPRLRDDPGVALGVPGGQLTAAFAHHPLFRTVSLLYGYLLADRHFFGGSGSTGCCRGCC